MFHRVWLSLSLVVVLGGTPALAQATHSAPFTPTAAPAKAVSSKKKKRKLKPPPPMAEDLIEPLVSKPGWVWVELAAPVHGAHVFLDGKDVGVLPLDSPLSVPAGTHLLAAKRLGFKAFEQRIEVKSGAAIEVLAQLEPLLAVLAVRSDVPDADVFIDGTNIGRTPLEDFVIEPGAHEVRIQHPGYQAAVSKVQAQAGAEYSVIAHLLKPALHPSLAEAPSREEGSRLLSPLPTSAEASATSQPWYGHWYVWAGAGAVVAVTVGVVLITRNQPLRVCQHHCDATIPALVRF
jgi:hypothetical protein